MVLGSLETSDRYVSLHPLLGELFEYVRTHDLLHAPAERITLRGDDLFINIADARLLTAEAQKLEVHRAYLDVHFPLSGPKIFGWRHLGDIDVEPEAPFNAEADFALYPAPAATYLTLHPGEFAIVWPEDAHAPIIGEGCLRKAIAKIRI